MYRERNETRKGDCKRGEIDGEQYRWVENCNMNVTQLWLWKHVTRWVLMRGHTMSLLI